MMEANDAGDGSAAAEMIEQYNFYKNWLLEVKPRVQRVEYRERPDGESAYIVHFHTPIVGLEGVEISLCSSKLQVSME